MRPLRTISLLAALMLAAAVAAPGVGAFQETKSSGATGLLTVPDDAFDPGIKCKYENHAGTNKDELDRIRVHGHWSHGPYMEKTWVGSRFIVKANTKPYGDAKWRKVFRSRTIKGKADDVTVADFKGRTWYAPENHKTRYRVQLIILYYAKGSKTKIVGKKKGTFDVYSHLQGSNSRANVGTEGGPAGFCYQKYHAAPPAS